MRLPSVLPLVGAAAIAGCAVRSAPTPVRGPALAVSPLADTILAVDAARGDSIDRLGYLDGMTVMLAPDAVFLRAGQPMVFGRERVRRMLAAAAPAGGTAMRWQPVRVGVSRDGAAAYTVGIAARPSPGDAGRPTLRLARYIAYWRREPGDSWRVAAYVEVGPAPVTSPVVSDAGGPAVPAGGRDSIVRLLEATDSAFSALAGRAGRAVAFGDYAAPDAMVFGGSRLVVGQAAIRALNAGPDGGVLRWHAVAGAAAGSADLGFTVGEYVFTPTSGGEPGRGKYLTIWEATPSGTWRYVSDGGNPTSAR